MSKEMLIELWQDIRHFVPAKERLDVADRLVAVFDQHNMLDGIEDEVGLDKTLRAAVVSHFHIDEDEASDHGDDDDDDY